MFPPNLSVLLYGLHFAPHLPILWKAVRQRAKDEGRGLLRALNVGSCLHRIHVRDEDIVDLFQGKTCDLWSEEIQHRHKAAIEACKDEVCFPLEQIDHHGCDHDDEEVPEPNARHAQCTALGSYVQRQDFGTVYAATVRIFIRAL